MIWYTYMAIPQIWHGRGELQPSPGFVHVSNGPTAQLDGRLASRTSVGKVASEFGRIGGSIMTEKTEDRSTTAVVQEKPAEPHDDAASARRALLRKLGRFAAVTPPAVTLLLAATAKPNKAQAASGFSSKSLKSAAGKVDTASILAGVAALPVDAWRYKPATGLEQQTHIGPFAEDFQAAFGVGNGVTISTIDAIGVCLAAIKALSERVDTLKGELQAAHRRTAA